MEIYNTIYYQKKFHESNEELAPEIYLTTLLNNYFRSLSIIYKYPYEFKWNSILYNFSLNYELTNNRIFTLNVSKGLLSLDKTLIDIEENFTLELPDISISNYKYCNILFTVEFDFSNYVNDSSKLPKFKLYLYDSITGELYNPDLDFDYRNVIILETYSIYYKNNNFTIVPYNRRLMIDEVYDKNNYIYLNPPPPYIPRPYPNVQNDNPDYTHGHVLTHNHCFSNTHDHNSNITLITNYYSEKLKIGENIIPPPTNIINNILSLDNPILDILEFELPLTLELFNKCNLETINLNNLSFDFRYIDPYADKIKDYNNKKYNYSKILNYKNVVNNNIIINNLIYPVRTENYWLYLLRQHEFNIYNNDIFNSLKYKYIFEDNIFNFGCFCS